jgi:predicted nicotinamide N-methyase
MAHLETRRGEAGRVSDIGEQAVRDYARLAPVPFLPELRLYQAPERVGLWDQSGGEYRSDQPPPFWAFAWAGGLALARYLLDHPQLVTGRRVVDLAAGSGVVAVAASLAGASWVRAVDIDPYAAAAARLNAAANGVSVEAVCADVLDSEVEADVVLVGDGFYTRSIADRMTGFLRRAAKGGARVLVGDPDREFLPRRFFDKLTEYAVPVRPVLEDVRVKQTAVWQWRGPTQTVSHA